MTHYSNLEHLPEAFYSIGNTTVYISLDIDSGLYSVWADKAGTRRIAYAETVREAEAYAHAFACQ